MNKNKWLGGVSATIISGVAVFWLTEPLLRSQSPTLSDTGPQSPVSSSVEVSFTSPVDQKPSSEVQLEPDKSIQVSQASSKRREWFNAAAITSIGNTLYIIQDAGNGPSLYEVTPGSSSENGTQVGTTGTWGNTNLMTSVGNKLYMIQDVRLFELDPNISNPSVRRVGGREWFNAAAITSIGNTLYIIQDAGNGPSLYEVTPGSSSENGTQVGTTGTWGNTNLMTSVGNKLYMIQDVRLFELDPNISNPSVRRVGG